MRYLEHLITEETKTIHTLHSRIHECFAKRSSSDAAYQAWKDACTAFHHYDSPLYALVEEACEATNYSKTHVLEFAIAYIEVDPWYFRSGYTKQKILSRLKSAKLSASQKKRLTNVLIQSVDRPGTGVFKYYCRLAVVLDNNHLRSRLKQLACSQGKIGRNARRMLDYCERHQTG